MYFVYSNGYEWVYLDYKCITLNIYKRPCHVYSRIIISIKWR